MTQFLLLAVPVLISSYVFSFLVLVSIFPMTIVVGKTKENNTGFYYLTNIISLSFGVFNYCFVVFLKIHRRSARRILKLCDSNKGFYVKAGQFIAAARQVPKEYSSTLSSLQDQVFTFHRLISFVFK